MTTTTWLPSRSELMDLLAAIGVLSLALLGYRQAFGGWAFLAAGAGGAGLGVALGLVTTRARLPMLAVALACLAVAVVAGGVVLHDTAFGGILPSVATVTELGRVAISGWKQLLTTVRPLGDESHLLALPYLLGLVGGLTTQKLARLRSPAAPLAPAGVIAALSVLLGGPKPSAAFLQGCVLTVACVGWAAARRARGVVALVRSNRRLFRPAAASALLVVTCLGAWVLGPHLPWSTSRSRTVVSIEPPFDPAAFASPLGTFRNFTKNSPTPLADVPLLRVSGDLDADRAVRLATLDDYDGHVWGASNQASPVSRVAGFAEVGSRLPTSGSGRSREAVVAIEPGYAGSVWLPTLGSPQGLSLGGPDSRGLRRSLRYSVATATGIVPLGLRAGDSVRLRYQATTQLSRDQLAGASPVGEPTVGSDAYAGVRETAVKWSETATSPVGRVLAIADKLVAIGRYSDGQDLVPSDPGHGAGRLATFLQEEQLVGDDEQYAAAMALMANAVGVPARVVLQAVVPADGVVHGRDVQAAVELALTGHGWVTLPTASFTPDRNKRPQQRPRTKLPEVPPKIVPPPLQPLTLSTTTSSQADTSANRRQPSHRGFSFHIPAVVLTAARWTAPPGLLVLTLSALILGIKGLRRSRRRTRGAPSARIVNGWAEAVDRLRDLGHVVPGGTRREQAATVPDLPLRPLAHSADSVVFGPAEPTTEEVDRYWVTVEELRRAVVADLSVWRRIRAELSLRSLAPGLFAESTTLRATGGLRPGTAT